MICLLFLILKTSVTILNSELFKEHLEDEIGILDVRVVTDASMGEFY